MKMLGRPYWRGRLGAGRRNGGVPRSRWQGTAVGLLLCFCLPVAAQQGPFRGLGVMLYEDGGVKIALVGRGTPAEQAGLKVNDQIVAVGDTASTGSSVAEVVVLIRKAGPVVTLGIKRGDGEPRQLRVRTDVIASRSAFGYSLEELLRAQTAALGRRQLSGALVLQVGDIEGDVVIDRPGLCPTESAPVIILGSAFQQEPARITGSLLIRNARHFQLDGFVLDAGAELALVNVPGARIVNCIVHGAGVKLIDCPAGYIVGNTFDYRGAEAGLGLYGSADTIIANNLFLCDKGTQAFTSWRGGARQRLQLVLSRSGLCVLRAQQPT